jgi:hypothetical protein
VFIIPLLGVIATDVFHHATCVGEWHFPIMYLRFYLMMAKYNGRKILQKVNNERTVKCCVCLENKSILVTSIKG